MGLISLAQGCPNLDCLEVKLLDISNEALECVGTHLKNLRVFCNWWGCEDGITDTSLDNGVRAMLMGCTKLERLDIDLCVGGLTDVGLGYVGMYGHNLRSLSLWNVGESDVGLLELSKGCPKLRKLRLKGCPFSEQAVASFVFNNNHSLRYVWIEYAVLTRPMVSDEMGESRKEKASEAECSRLDDFTEDILQEVACPSRSDDHTQEVKEEYEDGVESKVCRNEEEVQADIFAVEGSGKHHEDKPGSGQSQCADNLNLLSST
ncbi:hypothetical protein CTI12_AA279760 [Artemisia annua]|uniref:Leucine-rich repeat, cysteine-containing subtype n=1 Tax=Artemisia annua TaxID=35608 RepID=A0A2U1NB59_ARTAN|nr:hypothetical protein CTI12_AA279760 [Artemisia annua]